MADVTPWNHNNGLGRTLIEELPARVASALDLGCGQGYLLPSLAARADRVVGLDGDAASLVEAAERTSDLANVTLVEGDIFGTDLTETFDAVLNVAVLHHLPLDPGLRRMAHLVAPGGTLLVLGLARSTRARDWWWDAVGFVETRLRLLRHRRYAPVTAPIQDPSETYAEVEAAAKRILPGVRYRRHALFRYSLVWTKPT